MLTVRLFRAGEAPVEARLDDWESCCQDETVTFWVDLEAPAAEEFVAVARRFGVHERAIELAQRTDRQPVVRFFPDHYLATVLTIDVDETQQRPRMSVVEVDAFVGKNFLLTCHSRPLPFAEELRERTDHNPLLGQYAASHLLYAVLDTLITHYARELDEIEENVQRLEERLLREVGGAAPSEALVLKRHIQRVRRVIAPHREALGALVGADSPIDETTVENYLRDLLSRLNRVIERIDHSRDLATGSFNLYISNITHRTNQQLRVLTFLSAVLLPITAVTGLFGTNFKLVAYDSSGGFFTMLIGLALTTGGMLAFFRRRRWL